MKTHDTRYSIPNVIYKRVSDKKERYDSTGVFRGALKPGTPKSLLITVSGSVGYPI